MCHLAIQLATASTHQRRGIINSLHLTPKAISKIQKYDPVNAFANPHSVVENVSPKKQKMEKHVKFAPVVEMRYIRTAWIRKFDRFRVGDGSY